MTLTSQQILSIAIAHHDAGRLAQAEALYRQVIAQSPNDARALFRLGALLGQTGRIGLAIDQARRAAELDPSAAEAWCNLGEFLRRAARLDEAIDSLRQAVRVDPKYALAWNNLAAALKDQGRLVEATEACQAALAARFDYADAWCNLGLIYRERKMPADAEISLRRAIEVSPGSADAHSSLGIVLKESGRTAEALAACKRAAELSSESFQSQTNLGIVLSEIGWHDQAAAAHRRAVRLKPDSPEAWYNLATALRSAGQLDEAMAGYARTIQLKPDHAEAYANLGATCKDTGRLDSAIEYSRKAIEIWPEFAAVHSNLLYTIWFHADYDMPKILAEHRAYDVRHTAPLTRQAGKGGFDPGHDFSPDRKLRVGYVSADFKRHSAACFLLPLLENHDPHAVQIFCYSGVKEPDEYTERFRALPSVVGGGWRDSAGMKNAELASQITRDRIDVLVDLSLHMAGNRMQVFARKPAPVQVTWLGYPGTTGVPAIDYRLTDPRLDPPDAPHETAEEPYRLPRTFWCYRPLIDAPAPNELPAFKNGCITFGCFNNFCKVTPPTKTLWISVLAAIPGSRLIVQAPIGRHRDEMRREFEAAGISADRVEFVGQLPGEAYFRLFHRVDACLDPFPYPGHTTTLDALWMGVPVVTLAGATPPSRGGVSLLTSAGLPEFIARTRDEYVEIARRTAGDLDVLSRIRQTLRDRMAVSALTDGPAFARDMEAAFREMWRRSCAART